MVHLTIDDFFNGRDLPDIPGDMYFYRDDDARLLYIGESNHVERRLLEHLGLTWRALSSSVGATVIKNLPNSLVWTVDVYELKECKAMLPDSVTSHLVDDVFTFAYDKGNRRAVERALIECLHPALNCVHNSGSETVITWAQVRGTKQGDVLRRLVHYGRSIKKYYPFKPDNVPSWEDLVQRE